MLDDNEDRIPVIEQKIEILIDSLIHGETETHELRETVDAFTQSTKSALDGYRQRKWKRKPSYSA
jgi:hypothetical protein